MSIVGLETEYINQRGGYRVNLRLSKQYRISQILKQYGSI